MEQWKGHSNCERAKDWIYVPIIRCFLILDTNKTLVLGPLIKNDEVYTYRRHRAFWIYFWILLGFFMRFGLILHTSISDP